MFKRISNKLPLKIDNENFPLIILGHIAFAILFLFSAYFYKERIIFTDSAFQFFKIINFERINIEAHRYGAILPQLPVLFLTKSAINLKWLTIIYSCSFTLLYYVIFLICIYLLKNKDAGFSIVLILTLCISQSFFHPVTETHQSLVFSVLLYAILRFNKFPHSFVKFFLSVFIIVLSFLAHPVALYSIVFVIGYVAIKKRQLKSLLPYSLLIIIGLMAISKVLLTKENSYEGQFFAELSNLPEILLGLHKNQSIKFFITRAGSIYIWLIAMELILIVYLITNKHFLVLFWQLIVIFGFMLITIITYHKGDATLMMERAFMPLALFVAIPFVHEIKSNKNKIVILKIALLAFVVTFGLNRIFQQGLKFKTRTEFNQDLLKKTAHIPNRKFIIEKSELDKYVTTFWSNSFESLILSTIDVNVPTQTIFPSNKIDELSKYTEDAYSVFLGSEFWLEWNIESLNPKYFSLPANQTYKVIKLDEL